jgi:hypothetical protein
VSQPQPYSPQHAFVSDSANLPFFPGQSLDIEFNNVQVTTDQIRANLALIQRDDGPLANGIVTYDSLSAALQTNGIAIATNWTTGTRYFVGIPVIQGGNVYSASCSISPARSRPIWLTDFGCFPSRCRLAPSPARRVRRAFKETPARLAPATAEHPRRRLRSRPDRLLSRPRQGWPIRLERRSATGRRGDV